MSLPTRSYTSPSSKIDGRPLAGFSSITVRFIPDTDYGFGTCGDTGFGIRFAGLAFSSGVGPWRPRIPNANLPRDLQFASVTLTDAPKLHRRPKSEIVRFVGKWQAAGEIH